jgi:CRP-like cAMP-binding protein
MKPPESSSKRELLAILRRLPLFSDLSEPELLAFGEFVTRHTYDLGTIIFSEGDACRELLIVEAGSVRLLKSAPNGRQQLIGIERTGNSLAEVPVFDGGEYSATAETTTATTLLRVEAQHFRRICLEHPQVAVKFIKVLGHRLRHLDTLVEQLAFSSVRARLIAYLLSLSEAGRHTPRGVEFDLTENNEELAARLATVRELVSRNLGRLHNEGLIAMHRRKVTIPDSAALKRAGTQE